MTFPRFALATAGALLFMMAPSCRSYSDYCAEETDCRGGNEADQEACEVSQEARFDNADLQGCSDEFDLLFECEELESDCENDNYGVFDDSCEDEQRDYANCVD